MVSVVVLGVLPHLELVLNGGDLNAEDALVLADQGERLDDLEVVLVDVLDLEVDGVHLVDALHDLVLLGDRLLL